MKLFGASLITLGLLFSFVFFIVIMVLLLTDNVSIYFAIVLTIIINVIFWLLGPKITDWINRKFYKVEFMNQQAVEQLHPQVAQLIASVATEHTFPFPKVGIIPDNNPTAFTYGSARYNARLIVTQGIFKYLNEDEQKAVVAHELGHIVNRDFVVMMIASTLVQILYEIYAVLGRSRGKKNALATIGLISYVLYLIGTYLLLFLSRTREKLADAFSASITEPDDLSTALIKVAYGIVTEADEGATSRLLSSTRHMGLVDVKDARTPSSISYIAHQSRSILAEAMVFDNYNPWAKLLELNSTHPLTGRRIQLLSRMKSKSGRTFSYDVPGAAAGMNLDSGKLWGNLFKDLGITLLPFVLFIGLLFTKSYALAFFGLAAGFIVKAFYRYPRTQPATTTVLDEMRNPYASPIRGKSVSIEGQVVGRGTAGYIFSEDMMYQDKSGLIFINYHSLFGFFGNIFFALKKVKALMSLQSSVNGWFYRGMASSLTLKSLQSEHGTVKSYQHVWALVWPVILIVVTVLFVIAGAR